MLGNETRCADTPNYRIPRDLCRVEFLDHGMSSLVKLRHRNVCKEGFDLEGVADAGPSSITRYITRTVHACARQAETGLWSFLLVCLLGSKQCSSISLHLGKPSSQLSEQ